MNHLANTRGVYPFEKNISLGFIKDPVENHDDDSKVVKETFTKIITDIFEEAAPGIINDEPYFQHIIAYKISTDIHSEIVLVFIKQACNLDFSDQIIVQDRLFGKIRNEYIYQSTDGRNGDIVRIHLGDIAAINHNVSAGLTAFTKGDSSKGLYDEHEEYVEEEELQDLLDFTLVGEVVDLRSSQAEQLNYPHSDRLYSFDSVL